MEVKEVNKKINKIDKYIHTYINKIDKQDENEQLNDREQAEATAASTGLYLCVVNRTCWKLASEGVAVTKVGVGLRRPRALAMVP